MNERKLCKKKEKCKRKYNAIPNSLLSLTEIDNVFFYYLCSKSTDGNKPGSYIEKRVNEIDNVLDQLLMGNDLEFSSTTAIGCII